MRTDTSLTMTALIALAALGACTTTGENAPAQLSTCNPKAAANLVGQVAPDDAVILRRTHSSIIRRLPPGDAMTKDYRVERITVTVADGRIVSSSCG
ncbi:I78 family peptidase inhibitor [Sphingomonas sp. PB1R3]|uniref:I78 family peptidase inhibitor n=1 Tax=Sphingomonas flavida TaxID=3096154 RepID=UPI002FC99D1D